MTGDPKMVDGLAELRRRPRRHRRGLLYLAIACATLVVLWCAGLLIFATLMPEAVDEARARTDAIVVLTGGSGRLRQGLQLLADKQARKLFVSGVYRGVDVAALLQVSQHSPEELECCVFIGYEADDTRGNAAETAAWIRDQKFLSLRLVTATYHMPRSLLEFRRAMPTVEIIAHPVFPETFKRADWWLWPGSASLVISEYVKYLIAALRGPAPVRPP
jgi:uncharacterized SAM-binding protein YcdF (DUF218 family)